MKALGIRRWAVPVAAGLLALALARGATAQALYYQEVAREGRVYVFADGQRYAAWNQSGELGQAITRVGYGPNGETVVFDGEEAIGLYNFRHGLPGEVFEKPAAPAQAAYPKGRVTGLAFGDYYWFSEHHDARFDSQQGFWLRRAYLGWDQDFSAAWSARLRLEANSNGQMAGGSLNPYVKDAWLAWKYHGRHQARLGLQPSLTFDSEEGFWGLRHVEKTPADLYRIDASRDFGLAFSGPVGGSGLSYAAQLGNDSGSGSETDEYKVVRFLGLFEGKSGLRAEGAFNYGQRAGGQDRTTAKGLLGYRSRAFRLAGEYLWQERQSGKPGTPDTTLQVWSAFSVWDVRPKKVSLFGRFDRVKGRQGGSDVGLPGADGIDYLALSPKSPFKGLVAGFEWYLHPSVRVGPSVEAFTYDLSSIPDDVVWRLTFFWSW